jgi:predicted nucleotidyltransferase
MVTTKQQALQIAAKAREGLEKIYAKRLRGVYLYGSAARGQLTRDSDIDIAVILDEITDRFAEHERTGDLGSQISLEYNTLVSFFFVPQCDYEQGKYAAYRAIKREGISV